MPRTMTAEEIQQKARERNPSLSLVFETFQSLRMPATWIEDGYGEFQQKPYNVLYNSPYHPKRSKELRDDGMRQWLSDPDVQRRRTETIQEKYGVRYTVQSPEVIKKTQTTILDKYGCSNVLSSPDIRKQIIKTNLERYGHPNPMQAESVKSKTFATKYANGSLTKSQKEKELMTCVLQWIKIARPTSLIGVSGQKVFNIDILIPEKKIAIEFNGMYWHSEANKFHYPRKHLDKTLSCEAKNIRLIHIWEYEWDTQREKVLSYLRSVLGMNDRKIMARKCQIIEISKKDGAVFMEKSHLLGKAPNSHGYLALSHDGEIVSVASFGKHHRNLDQAVLSRFASLSGTTVSGALGKLSTEGMRKYGPLVTWCERRLGSTHAYEAAGWKIDEVLPPDYFYWHDREKRVISKQSRKKSAVNTPEGMTEHEHALHDGLLRIWDCGKTRLIMRST